MNPAIAVIEVGADNLNDDPSPKVVTRLENCGATVYRTDANGSIRVTATRVDHTASTGIALMAPTTITTTAPTTSSAPEPAQTVPVITTKPTCACGKQYAVGDPGAFIGGYFGSDKTIAEVVRPISVTTTSPTYAPGSGAYGITPPTGQFVRWYPAARWKAGIP